MAEARPREFRARFARRAPSIAARQRGPRGVRRLLLLAAAVAVPAMAQAHLAADFGQAGWLAPSTRPTDSERPGGSYADPAFYERADKALPEKFLTSATAALALPRIFPGGLDAGPAARALRLAGTATDRMRAQYCLTAAIYYEAGAETDAGQRAVAQVVLNRMAHPAFPATVCGVVFQGSERSSGCQFTFTCDGSMARTPARMAWMRASRAARAALAGFVYAPVGLATHYHTVQIHPYWADTLDGVGTIGAHRFYRWRGAAGQPKAFFVRYPGGEPPPMPAVHPFGGNVPLAAAGQFEAAPALPGPSASEGVPGVATSALAPALAPTPAAAPTMPLSTGASVTDRFSRSGQARREFEGSGRWLNRP